MLGKLMKYELKATWKLLLPMNALIVVMALLTYCTIKVDFFDSDSSAIVATGVTVVMFYILSIFVVWIGTSIYLIYRFYTSTYGDQGYLLHTLPVDTHHIIVAKTVISAGWLLLSSLLMFLSVFLLLSSDEYVFEMIWDGMLSFFELLGGGKVEGGFTAVMLTIASIFTIIARVLKVGACISLGQISPNHKVLVSFAIYYGVYLIQRIFSMIYYAVLAVVNKDTFVSGLFYSSSSLWGSTWEISLISGILYSVAFYLITWYMMEKKLNLD